MKIGKLKIEFYFYYQSRPLFKLNFWRHRRDKETLEFGIILFGCWFVCKLDHPRFGRPLSKYE